MTTDFHAGSTIGNYVLDSYLGGGGFGSVWLAHAANGSRKVAIKLLTGGLAEGDSTALRADIEVLAAAAAARSEHVVKMLGGGVDPVPYIVMEYIEGNDLSSLLAAQGHLTYRMTIDVGIGISDALRALSEAGIIHRDIKPANVMIDSAGVVKLADFGIAKIVGYETLTMTGQTAMTMAYAAPEVWDDSGRFGKPTTKLDLYALGVVLFQCLAGAPPFNGNFGALYRQHTEQPPDLSVLPADVPPSLRLLIQRCLEKRQDDRPRDAAECLAILRRAEAELAEGGKKEPTHFGPWIKDSPHERQVWAWNCHHESRGDRATVEVHFSDSVDYAAVLRKAVAANRALMPFGAERLIETNRLLLHPDEAWWEPPPGRFQFWIARDELQVTPATSVAEPMLRTAVAAFAGLIETAAREGVALDFAGGNLTLLTDGKVYLRRPALAQPTAPAAETLLAFLDGQSLYPGARALLDEASSFDALVALVLHPEQSGDDATQVVQRRGADATILQPKTDGEQATVVRPRSTPDPDATDRPGQQRVITPRSTPGPAAGGRPEAPRSDTPPVAPLPPRQTPPAAQPPASRPVTPPATPAASPVSRATPQPSMPASQPGASPRVSAPAAAAVRSPSRRAADAGGTAPPRRPPTQPPRSEPPPRKRPWPLYFAGGAVALAGVAAAAFAFAFDGDIHKLPGAASAQAKPTTVPLTVVVRTPVRPAGTPAGGGGPRVIPTPTPPPVVADPVDALVFSSDRDGVEQVYFMNADGSGQKRLTTGAKANRLPNASPDGGQIVFVSARDADGSELYLMKSDGSAQSHITTADGIKLEPNVSPSGRRIVFEVQKGDNFDVNVSDIDGKNLVNLTNSPAADIDPVWSPDGARIVFGSNRDGNMDIWVMNANGTNPKRLTNSPGFNGEPAWSPDGKKIVFESDRRGNFDLYVMNDDGTNVVRLGDDPGDEYDPAWSPDGKLIAYTSKRGPTNEVFVIDADGTQPRNLSNNPANDGKPAWIKVKR